MVQIMALTMNTNMLFGILALSGVALVIIGNILNDVFDWIIIDAYFGIVFAILAYRLFSIRKVKN